MSQQITSILLMLTVLLSGSIYSQEKDTLKTDVINVVKAYKPTISDAFKVREKPALDESIAPQRKHIVYQIFSFPVASTFTPAKTKAEKIGKKKADTLYDNYASLGVGNYLHVLGDLYLSKTFGKIHNIGLYLGHHSSQGGINSLLVDDVFSNSRAKLDYALRSKTAVLKLGGGYQHQTYHWYGIPQPVFNSEKLNNFNTNVKHNYKNAFAKAEVTLDESLFTSGHLTYRHFGDNYASNENHVVMALIGKLPINGVSILTKLYGDGVKGNFKRAYTYNMPQDYNHIQFGISPSFQLLDDDTSLTLGITTVYSNSTGDKKNAIFIYPNIEGFYRLLDDTAIVYGMAKGGLLQHTYHTLTSEHPYVSPNLFIQPTHNPIDIATGIKGSLSNTIAYDLSVGFKAEKRKAMFKNQLISYGVSTDQGYHLGNAFGVVYDTVNTTTIAGQIDLDIITNFTMNVTGTYFKYTTKKEAYPWNLPNFKADVVLNYQIDKRWAAGCNVYILGQRKAITGLQYIPKLSTDSSSKIERVRTLNSFIDANVNVGYQIDKRLSAYVNVNNLLHNKYERWVHTPVQGIQFLFGATYTFNF